MCTASPIGCLSPPSQLRNYSRGRICVQTFHYDRLDGRDVVMRTMRLHTVSCATFFVRQESSLGLRFGWFFVVVCFPRTTTSGFTVANKRDKKKKKADTLRERWPPAADDITRRPRTRNRTTVPRPRALRRFYIQI